MIQEQINADFLTAYKAKNELEVSVLRLVKSSLKNEEIAKKTALTDDDAIKVLKKEVKQRKDSAAEYRKAGQEEPAVKEESEVKIIEKYLPTQLDEDAIRQIAKDKISSLGAANQSDMGKVIGAIMAEHGSEVDGGSVSRIVRELLS